MSLRNGKQGGSMGSVEYSPAKLKAMRKAKQRTEKRWASKSSGVKTRTGTLAEIAELLDKR